MRMPRRRPPIARPPDVRAEVDINEAKSAEKAKVASLEQEVPREISTPSVIALSIYLYRFQLLISSFAYA